jgi:calcineurin-like phosphoesterase family protein
MGKIFVTSDTHLGHANIIKYCNRPFADAESMTEHIINTWNARVSQDDLVYFLGDLAMGPGVDEGYIVDRLSELNGQLQVVLGNHDQPSKWCDGLEKISKDFALPITILPDIFELKHEGKRFVMCHYPMKDWNGKYHGTIHLHGHKHTQFSPTRARRMIAEKRYDIGVDMYGGPVQLTGDLRFLKDPKGWNV